MGSSMSSIMWSKLILLAIFVVVQPVYCTEKYQNNLWNPYNLDTQKSAVQYGFNNEIETNTNVKDKEAFFRLINMILWNTPELNDSQERQYFIEDKAYLVGLCLL